MIHSIEDYNRQLELEEDVKNHSIEKYHKVLRDIREKEKESVSEAGFAIIRKLINPFSEGIEELVTKCLTGKANRMASQVKLLTEYEGDYDTVSFIVLRVVLNGIVNERKMTAVAGQVANALEDELQYRHMKNEHPGLYRKMSGQFQTTTSEAHVRKVITYTMNKFDISREKWGVDRMKLAIKLLHMLAETTGCIEIKRITKSKHNTPYVISPSHDMLELLERTHSFCQLISPLHVPLLVPPKDWSNSYDGGYWGDMRCTSLPLTFVKTRNKAYLEELENIDMQGVYDAVNSLQKTGWKINTSVLKVMKEVWSDGGMLGKLPPRESLPMPAKPEDIATNKAARDAWKFKAATVYQNEVKVRSSRIATQMKIELAEKLKDEDAFYFIWNCDWRGRAYPVATSISPQSDDIGRSLLKFSEGKPMGEGGGYWLAVHLANSFGYDKVSLHERVKWVLDNEEAILDSAASPIEGHRFWTQADKPWAFLAACFAWLGFSIEGDSYVCDIPVNVDGNCNGLQNFSGALHDEVGGKSTGLVPTDSPEDIYEEVAKVVRRKAIEAGGEYAEAWKGKITRQIVKRPAMTYAYSASRYGMKQQILSVLKKHEKDTGKTYLASHINPLKACEFIANICYESIGEVVKSARDAMDWLKEVAKVATKTGLPIHWTTPIQFPVLQDYMLMDKRIITLYLDKQYKISTKVVTDKRDSKKMTQSISANFIHSMDASHLMSTINTAVQNDITHFAMVHDSYGTHPCDVDTMLVILKEEFINQYRGNVLEYFKEEICQQLPDKLAANIPDIPQMGDLDLDAIKTSDYFFA